MDDKRLDDKLDHKAKGKRKAVESDFDRNREQLAP